ncbi:MAG: hypothetical protein KDK97_20540 [Verrucomicrobiales bacterium]|nr:hypothetical protein [Verrucomicrobiales bacterium]
MSDLMRRVLRAGRFCTWCVVAIGLILQFGLKDRYDVFAAYFYALPLPVLVGFCVALTFCPGAPRRKVSAVLGLVLASVWVARSWQHHAPIATEPGGKELRVMFWNMSRPDEPCQALIERVRELRPDIVGCVEPGIKAASHLPAYQKALPDYKVDFMPRGLLWLTKLPDRRRERGKLDGLGAFTIWEVDYGQNIMRTVLVDVYAHPWMTRRRQLAETLAMTQGDPLALVMGDFNTPAESVHLVPYRQQMTNAFEAAGNGFRETWFWGLPLLSLDQIWVGSGWEVLEARKIQDWQSDHTLMFVRLRQR